VLQEGWVPIRCGDQPEVGGSVGRFSEALVLAVPIEDAQEPGMQFRGELSDLG
jgi:hypothetical protein